MEPRWRLLLDGPASGWRNMAVDEALLASVLEGGPPTVRLYAWRGSWLSLGHAQKLAPERAAACTAAGVRVLRRVTGGRAVLHGRDLAYAVAAPAVLLPEGLAGSYRLLSEAVVAALRALGVEATRAAAPPLRAGQAAFDCFAAPAPEEVCVSGRKLAGSAQRRCADALLQHGSIRLAPDPPEAACAAAVGQGASSLAELGVAAAGRRLRQALVATLAERLDAALEPARLSPAEARRAHAGARALRRAPLEPRFPVRFPVSRALLDGRYD